MKEKPKERKLTLKQEKFCVLYATDHSFFGNATQAYIKAYNIDVSVPGQYSVAAQSANDNLKKPHIYKRINQLLEDIGFSDAEVDKQLAFLIAQHGDLRTKVAAIKEYNALKSRITKKVVVDDLRDSDGKIKDFLDDTDDGAYDEPSEQPPANVEPAGSDEVADAAQDVS